MKIILKKPKNSRFQDFDKFIYDVPFNFKISQTNNYIVSINIDSSIFKFHISRDKILNEEKDSKYTKIIIDDKFSDSIYLKLKYFMYQQCIA